MTLEHEIRDELVKVASDNDRRAGRMPKPADVESYLRDALTQAEQKRKEAKPVKVAKVDRTPEERADQIMRERKKIAKRHGLELLDAEIEILPPRPISDLSLQPRRKNKLDFLLTARIKMLFDLPDWRARFTVINPFAINGGLGHAKQKEAEKYLRKIIRDSDVTFGPWWKPKPLKLWSYKGQAKRGLIVGPNDA